MNELNASLARIESRQLWAYFHKDWLLQMRSALRPQLPHEYSNFVESEAILVGPSPELRPAAYGPDLGVARSETKAASRGDAGKTTAALVEVEEPCEIYHTYTLLIRRAPENRLVAALEPLSPTNKGAYGVWDRDKYLRKRAQYLESAISVLEIDALLGGERLLPISLARLHDHSRTAWTAFHEDGKRRLRGWGWNEEEPPPTVAWGVEGGLSVIVDLAQTLREAAALNPWESLAR